jgi:S-adenosylmethionine synthetase
MKITNGIFTSEAVSAGHPDKICDQVSDAILDACLAEDPTSRVAIEAAMKGSTVCLLGEITTTAEPDFKAIVREVLSDIGHADARWGVDVDRLNFTIDVSRQSAEIAAGVGTNELGAGDQGIMFGYATDETPSLMPAPIEHAWQLLRAHERLQQGKYFGLLGPDAKAQVSVAYRDGRPYHISAIVLSTQHSPDLSLADLRDLIETEILRPVLGEHIRQETAIHINPAGTFHSGGPVADAGLTGRKIIADTYGGFARHGGGAFSGKDATKVDRSAAYAARQIARHAVTSGWTRTCEIQVAYAIGVEHPIAVDFVGASASEADTLRERFENAGIDLPDLLRPASIIRRLGLRKPCFRATASGGHFGQAAFAWEIVPLA